MTRVPTNQSPIPSISMPPPIFQHHQWIQLHVYYFYVNRLHYLHKNRLIQILSQYRQKKNVKEPFDRVCQCYYEIQSKRFYGIVRTW